MDDKCTWCGSPDHSERSCSFGEHGDAEAVIRHVAVVDHDYEADCEPPVALLSPNGARMHLHGLVSRTQDGVLAEAIGHLGDARAAELYLDERRRLRG